MAHHWDPRTVHTFRCLEGLHTFDEMRDPNGPLGLRQSAWCATHDCPAVGVGDDVRAAAMAQRRSRRPA